MANKAFKGIWRLVSNTSITNAIERSSHTLNFINQKLYVIGGEHESRVPIDNNIIFFDLESNKWDIIEPKCSDYSENNSLPRPRIAHGSCTIDDKIYIFGGRVGIEMGEGSLNDLYELNTVSNIWQQIDDGKTENFKRPLSRSYHAMTSLKEKIYVFGGCADDRLNDFYSYDTIKREWQRLAQDDRITPRGGSSICAYSIKNEDFIFLIGGFAGHELNDCWSYSIENNSWSPLPCLPLGLSVFALASNGTSNILLHGGELGPSKEGHKSAGEFSTETYAFNGQVWSKVETTNAPTARAWHAATFANGKLYVYGGLLENSQRTNELWCLDLD